MLKCPTLARRLTEFLDKVMLKASWLQQYVLQGLVRHSFCCVFALTSGHRLTIPCFETRLKQEC